MLNKVGFYQVAKLLIIPFVCGVERVWLGRRFTPAVTAAVGVVIVGVAIVTVSNVTSVGGASTLGASVAAVSVVSSGMQQILCRVMQQAHGLTAHELLSVTAPAQVSWELGLWRAVVFIVFVDSFFPHFRPPFPPPNSITGHHPVRHRPLPGPPHLGRLGV